MNKQTLNFLIEDKQYFIDQLHSYLRWKKQKKIIPSMFPKLYLPIVQDFTKRKIERTIKKSEKFILRLKKKYHKLTKES